MKKLVMIILATASLTVQAQRVTFASPAIEAGVRMHLGLDGQADILQSQTDTITAIDLSGLGITSLNDMVYLPNVQRLNLADNEITDIGPLNVLDSLRDLDLRNNNLEGVNLLAFSNSTKMMVDVTSNYISDFTFLFDCFKCQLTLVGMGMQKVKDAPYLDVYHLYANIGEDGKTMVCYRGYTNIASGICLECGGSQAAATLDGNTHESAVPGQPTETTMVRLSNGTDDGDSTWVIPSKVYNVKGGERLTIATGLPSTYRIGSLNAQHGTVSTTGEAGLDIVYEAPAQAVDDAIYLNYYEGSKLRGFAQLSIADSPDYILGDINGDGVVDVSDYIGIANHILNYTPAGFNEKAADVNEDGVIDVSDYIGVANIILTGSIYGNQQQSRISRHGYME